jgi:hypothetical protein
MALSLCIIMKKANHKPKDLRKLGDAPYFGASLVSIKPEEPEQKRSRMRASHPPIRMDDLTDEDFLPKGTMIHSHSIAPSTRQAFEKLVGAKLPAVSRKKSETMMPAKDLKKMLDIKSKKSSNVSVSSLYELLETCADLGFAVAWCEGYDEGWLDELK